MVAVVTEETDECIRNLYGFVDGIEKSERFEIVGMNEGDTEFVLSDNTIPSTDEEQYISMDVEEVKNTNYEHALKVLHGEANEVSLKSYSRIVGYYSATHNWNASKQSELFRRSQGDYGTPSYVAAHQQEREEAIGAMRVAYGN